MTIDRKSLRNGNKHFNVLTTTYVVGTKKYCLNETVLLSTKHIKLGLHVTILLFTRVSEEVTVANDLCIKAGHGCKRFVYKSKS